MDEPPEEEAPPGVFEQKLAAWQSQGPSFRLWNVRDRRRPPRPELGVAGADD